MPPSTSNARRLLARTREVHVRMDQRHLRHTKSLLNNVNAVVTAHVQARWPSARIQLALYDGMPLQLDLLGTLGVTTSEAVHNTVLAWVLDPLQTHGLGDAVLRRFLARMNDPHLSRLASAASPIDAFVRTEATVGKGYLDVLVVVERAVISVECKVWSEEHEVKDPSGSAMQTIYYYNVLNSIDGRKQSLHAAEQKLAGPNPHVHGVFIRPAGKAYAKDPNHTRTLSWLHIERDLANALLHNPVDPSVALVLNGLRSTLLNSTGSVQPLMPAIQHLRLLMDTPALQKLNLQHTYKCLRAFLHEDDTHG